MASARSTWEPCTHPIHRLVHLLDLLIAGFERYHRFAPNKEEKAKRRLGQYAHDAHDATQQGRERALQLFREGTDSDNQPVKQLRQLRNRVLPEGAHAHHVHQELATGALAYFVRAGGKSVDAEAAIHRATDALVQLCCNDLIGHLHNSNYGPHAVELWQQEMVRLAEARFARQAILDVLPRIGEEIPAGIVQGQKFGDDLLAQFPPAVGTMAAVAAAPEPEPGQQPGPQAIATEPDDPNTTQADPPPAPTEPDGPFEADGFRFGGALLRFGRAVLRHRLVVALWDDDQRRPTPPRAVEDVIRDVWGDENQTEDAAFRSLCSAVRGEFEKANCPLDIRTVQGRVQMVRV